MITIIDRQPIMVYDYTKTYSDADKALWLAKFGADDIKLVGTHNEFFALAVYYNPREIDASVLASQFGANLTVKYSENLPGVKANTLTGTLNRSLVVYMRID